MDILLFAKFFLEFLLLLPTTLITMAITYIPITIKGCTIKGASAHELFAEDPLDINICPAIPLLEFAVIFLTVTEFAVILLAFIVSEVSVLNVEVPVIVNVPEMETGPLKLAVPANDVVLEKAAELVVIVLENVTVCPATSAE